MRIFVAFIGLVFVTILFERLHIPNKYYVCVLISYCVTADKICLDLKYKEDKNA